MASFNEDGVCFHFFRTVADFLRSTGEVVKADIIKVTVILKRESRG